MDWKTHVDVWYKVFHINEVGLLVDEKKTTSLASLFIVLFIGILWIFVFLYGINYSSRVRSFKNEDFYLFVYCNDDLVSNNTFWLWILTLLTLLHRPFNCLVYCETVIAWLGCLNHKLQIIYQSQIHFWFDHLYLFISLVPIESYKWLSML